MPSSLRSSFALLAAAAIAVTACAGDSLAPEPPALRIARAAEAPTTSEVEAQITTLFPAPGLRTAALTRFRSVDRQWARGETEDARTIAFDLMAFTLEHFESGNLLDPNGGEAPTTDQAMLALTFSVLRFVEMPVPEIPAGELGEDGAAQVVSNADGAEITAPTQKAGIEVAPGSMNVDYALITIVPAPDPPPESPYDGPLPGTYNEYRYAYTIEATADEPVVFSPKARIGLCTDHPGESPWAPPTQEVMDRLVIARESKTTPGELELFPREEPPAGLDCEESVHLAGVEDLGFDRKGLTAAWSFVRRGVGKATAPFRPTPLYAANRAIGTSVSDLSTWGLVDPESTRQANTLEFTEPFTTVGVGQQTSPNLVLAGDTGEVLVTLRHSNPGVVATPDSVLVHLSQNTAQLAFPATGVALGVDTVTASATGYEDAVTVIEVGLGKVTLAGLPDTLHAGDSVLVQLETRDHLGNARPVASATTFGLTPSDVISATDGNAPINSVTVPGRSGDVSFYVKAWTPGPATLTVTNADYEPVERSVQVDALFGSIAAGMEHTCAIGGSWEVYCWGSNVGGKLGSGHSSASTPQPVAAAEQFTSVSPGAFHTCALALGGTVYCWGGNALGELGDGSTNASTVPVAVAGGPFGQVVAAHGFSCAVTNGTRDAYCWGFNSDGQLGDGTTTNSTTPVHVASLAGEVLALDAGGSHACASAQQFRGYCWGLNSFGQLATGSSEPPQSSTPLLVSGINLQQIVSGNHHSCGLDTSGYAWCWGSNFYGQLGDGGTSHSASPVRVSVDLTFRQLTAGYDHTCGTLKTGASMCWGRNDFGQLGDGTTDQRLTPTPTQLAFEQISAGGWHTCGLSSGVPYCWGFNRDGQLGDGTTVDRAAPVQVLRP